MRRVAATRRLRLSRLLLGTALAAGASGAAGAQGSPPSPSTRADTAAPSAGGRSDAPPWFERLSLRGYIQARHNGLVQTNPAVRCAQCDGALGGNGGFSVRRIRLVLSGDLTERVSVFVQPDFASTVDGTGYVGQLRDAYADVAFDTARVFLVRFGQTRVPYGFENLQSSQQRAPLDRADPLNSMVINERDLGAVFFWTPRVVRRRLQTINASGLKGAGEHGLVALGLFNGQGAARPDADNRPHAAVRVTYPFELPSGQFVELGAQYYGGRYVLPASVRSPGLAARPSYRDERVAATFVWYPQPIGVVAEWNVGRGPEAVPEARAAEERRLSGGYVQAMYRLRAGRQVAVPFARWQRYDGGKKFELDARRHRVRDVELGVEWQASSAFELTLQYQIADRTFEDLATPVNRQRGRFLRAQAQVAF